MRQEQVRVIYKSMDTSKFVDAGHPDRNAIRSELGLRSHGTVIGIIGKVALHKGHEELFRAFAIASSQHSGLQLLVVGDTSMTGQDEFPNRLLELTKDLGIVHQVVFVGFRDDIPAIMSAIDMLAVPSHSEAFGRSAAEALAAGVPVIACDVGGLPEVVQHNITGLLVPPKSIEALADAILQLSRVPEMRRSMGEHGPSSVARFDISKHIQEFMRLYSDLTGTEVCDSRRDERLSPKVIGIR